MAPRDDIDRREFLASAAAGMALSIVPRHVLGGPGFTAPSDKLTLGYIGCGTQGIRELLRLLPLPDVQITAVCDPVKDGTNYVDWDKTGIRDGVRELLDKEKDLDSVKVMTPDHLHATISIARSATNSPAAKPPPSSVRARQERAAASQPGRSAGVCQRRIAERVATPSTPRSTRMPNQGPGKGFQDATARPPIDTRGAATADRGPLRCASIRIGCVADVSRRWPGRPARGPGRPA
jgi:hypothetical protein